MLTNSTLMKKFENILHKKHGTILHKIISSTTTHQKQTSTTSPLKYSTDLRQRENTNLKSNKKSKILEKFRKDEDEYFIELELENHKMETKIFTYSPRKNQLTS